MCASFLKRAHVSLYCTNRAKRFPLQLSYKLFNNLRLAVPGRTTPRTKIGLEIQIGTLTRSSPAPILSVRPKPRTMTRVTKLLATQRYRFFFDSA